MAEFLIFGKYTTSDVVVTDPGLTKYINLKPMLVLHTHGVYGRKHLGKKDMNIVERLINNLMRTGKYNGKKMSAYRVVKSAFEIIYEKTKKNPVQIYIDALQNSAPREEITRLKMGGAAIPKAVDVSPSRRLDLAIRNIALGSTNASFKNVKSIENCLAEEIMKASNREMGSYAISKKEEIERVAASAR